VADVLVVERDRELGGILTQCVHNGFGLRIFERDLTGPEYASEWIGMAMDAGVGALTDTMVLSISDDLTALAMSAAQGMVEIRPQAIVLCMGCRERPRGALAIPGTRPSGVYTAGTAQRLVNMEGLMPGNRVVILGSGDIGMIMARRMTLEGAQVGAMIEILPYVSGLKRNLVQCVRDYDIPLRLRSTVTRVTGQDRVEAVEISQVDGNWRPIPGSQEIIDCDTLLLSVGLIPENELSRMAGIALDPVTGGPYVNARYATSVPGIFAAGNSVHVYDIVDDVTESALTAGAAAAQYAMGKRPSQDATVALTAGQNVRHVVPQLLSLDDLEAGPVDVHMRVREPIEEAARVTASAESVVASSRLRYARPSEMVTLRLDPAMVDRLRGRSALRMDVRCRNDTEAGIARDS